MTERSNCWVECRELNSGNAVWYHKKTHKVRFDDPNINVVPTTPHRHNNDQSTIDKILGINGDDSVNNIEDVIDKHSWLKQYAQNDIDYLFPRYYTIPRIELLIRGYFRQNCDPLIFVTVLEELILKYVDIHVTITDGISTTTTTSTQTPQTNNYHDIFLIKVYLPSKYSQYTRWVIIKWYKNSDGTANDFISKCISKLKPNGQNTANKNKENFIIKQVGYEKYIYGDLLLTCFDSIKELIYSMDYQSNSISFKLIEIENINQLKKKKTRIKNNNNNNESNNNNSAMGNININTINITSVMKRRRSLLDAMGTRNWGLTIIALSNATYLSQYLENDEILRNVFVESELVFGDVIIPGSTLRTKVKPISSKVYFATIRMPAPRLHYCQLPNETILNLIVYGIKEGISKPVALAWIRIGLFDDNGEIRTGKKIFNLWEIDEKEDEMYTLLTNQKNNNGKENFRVCGTLCPPPTPPQQKYVNEKIGIDTQCRIMVKFDTFCQLTESQTKTKTKTQTQHTIEEQKHETKTTETNDDDNEEEKKINEKVESLIKNHSDLFDSNFFDNARRFEMSDEDKVFVWDQREKLVSNWKGLPLFLHCVDWCNVKQVVEAYEYIDKWQLNGKGSDSMYFIPYIRLLNYDFADCKIKQFVIRMLSFLEDKLLNLILIPLIECLKFDYFDQLSEFLLLRSIASPYRIGHYFFWYIRSQSSILNKYYHRKFFQILKIYLSYENVIHIEQYYYQSQIIKSLRKLTNTKYMLFNVEKDIYGHHTEDVQEKVKQQHLLLRNQLTKLQKRHFGRRGGGLGSGSSQYNNYTLPLNPSIGIKSIKLDKCTSYGEPCGRPAGGLRVINLVFENADDVGDDIYVSFGKTNRMKRIYKKNNDKLRYNAHQQMFIPNILSLINHIWAENKLYFPNVEKNCETMIVDISFTLCNASTFSMARGRDMSIDNAQTILSITQDGRFGKPYRDIGIILKYLEHANNNDTSNININNNKTAARNEFNNARSRVKKSFAAFIISYYLLGSRLGRIDLSNDIIISKDGGVYNYNFDSLCGRNPSGMVYYDEDAKKTVMFHSRIKYAIIDAQNKHSSNKHTYNEFVNMCGDAWNVFQIGYCYQRILIVLLSIMMNMNLLGMHDLDVIRKTTKMVQWDESFTIESNNAVSVDLVRKHIKKLLDRSSSALSNYRWDFRPHYHFWKKRPR